MSSPCFFSHYLTALLLSESTLSTSLSAGDFQILKFTNFDTIVLTLSCSTGDDFDPNSRDSLRCVSSFLPALGFQNPSARSWIILPALWAADVFRGSGLPLCDCCFWPVG